MDKMVKVGKFIIGGFVALIVIGLFMPTPPDTTSKSEVKTESVQKTKEPKPKNIKNEIKKEIENKLGSETNRDAKRNVKVYEFQDTLFITWAIDDNLFSDSRVRAVVRDVIEEITPILQTRAINLKPEDTKYSNFKSFYMMGTMAMIDKYGNAAGEKPVVEVEFTADTLSKINPENMKYQLENVYSISNTYIIHPAIRASSSPNGW